MREWDTQFKVKRERGGTIWPPQLYAYFSARFLKAASEGAMSPKQYDELQKELSQLEEAAERATASKPQS